MSDIHSAISRYYNTKIKDFYLDSWEPIYIPTSVNDEVYVVEPAFEGRPDLLANEKYRSPDLWWVFTLANPDAFIDPIDDLKAGMTIVVPSLRTVEKLF